MKLDMLLFSPLLIFLNPTVLMLTQCYFFLLTIKVAPDASSGSPKSCAGENESTSNNQCRGENIFYFCHLGKKLIKKFGLPKYQWGALVHPASQVHASICLKGTACVTCQLLRKGTKGADTCILFLFPSNYVNDKKPQRDYLP